MRDMLLEDHIIGIAKILGVSEFEVIDELRRAFEDKHLESNDVLIDAWWEFEGKQNQR